MAFGDVIRFASPPSGNATGIGGDSDTIWNCDNSSDNIYELDTSDFSTIRSASSPSSSPNGMGGDSNTIWHCDLTSGRVYELDADAPIISTVGSAFLMFV